MPNLARDGQANPIVMVLGMHRSGTSLCSHVLSVLGVDMADHMFPVWTGSETPGSDNPRGHWERWEIVEFHDRILAHFNRGYATPFHDLPLPAGWWADPKVAAIRREMVGFLATRMGESRFGFKDPRTVRLLPLWRQIFDDLNLAPKFVLCLRNPAEVARSLAARDTLDPVMGEHRWLIHMVDFFRNVGDNEYCAVEYENWFDDPWMNASKLQKFLDLDLQQSQGEVDLALLDIVDPALRHDSRKRSKVSLALVRSLYKLAARGDDDARVREQIQQITAQFAEFQQSEAPFRKSFERASVAAAKLPESERQVAELQAALADREAAVQAEQAALAAVMAELRTAQEETAALRVGLARADADGVGLRAALDEQAGALQQAKRDIAERDAAVAMLQNELAAVRRDHGDAMQAIRADLASARSALAERDSAATALAATLAERAAAATAMQAELLSMRDELAAARQVGRSLLAALRTGPALSPGTDQFVRQPQGIFRLIRRWTSRRGRSTIRAAR